MAHFLLALGLEFHPWNCMALLSTLVWLCITPDPTGNDLGDPQYHWALCYNIATHRAPYWLPWVQYVGSHMVSQILSGLIPEYTARTQP